MIRNIPAFIVSIINMIVKVLGCQESIEAIREGMVATIAQGTYESVELCLKLCLWAERRGVPCSHESLEELSQVFRVKLQDIQAVLGMLRIR